MFGKVNVKRTTAKSAANDHATPERLVVDVSLHHDTDLARSVNFANVVRTTLAEEGFTTGEISVVIVDRTAMHDLNRRHLDHDWTTDVLSFCYDVDEAAGRITGELIISDDYAAGEAPGRNWSESSELTLYAVHGSLHLAGYDDQEPEDRLVMRAAERRHITRLLGTPPVGSLDED